MSTALKRPRCDRAGILALVARGLPYPAVAAAAGCSVVWVGIVARRAGLGRGPLPPRRPPAPSPGACLWCGGPGPSAPLGICPPCAAQPLVRRVYRRSKRWCPAWEKHLRELTRRASLQLPLFD